MPTYDYTCPKCDSKFAEIRGIFDYSKDPSAKCPECGKVCGSKDRDFSLVRPEFLGTAVTSAEFNPGLGCVVKNKRHKEDILKRKGVVEVGNDFGAGEKMQETFEKKKKEELESNWKKDPGDFFL